MRGALKGMCEKGCKKMLGSKKVVAKDMKVCIELCKVGKSGEAICMFYWDDLNNNKKEAKKCIERIERYLKKIA